MVLDGTDNFDTRYLVNAFCVREGIPWIYGAAVGSYGLSMPVIPGRTACLKCVFPEAPGGVQPTCETAGVVNALTSAVASIQVSDALKLLCGHEVKPRISTLDVWSGDIRQVAQPEPDPACVACGRRDFVHLQPSNRAPFGLCGRNAEPVHEREQAIDLQELAGRLAPLVQSFDFRVLACVRAFAPEIPRAALCGLRVRDFVALAAEAGVSTVAPYHRAVNSRRIAEAHDAGIRVIAWTANRPREWDRLVRAGVDGIITDDPAGLLAHLGRGWR